VNYTLAKGFTMTVCPFCKAAFEEGETVVACLQCGTPHHDFCWIENGNQCTVYRCDGFQEVKAVRYLSTNKTRLISAAIIFQVALNYIFHFLIPELKPILSSIRLPDLTVVFLIEGIFLLSGAAILFSPRYAVSYQQDSVRFFASLVFLTNLLFVLGLLYFGLTAGWQTLASAIYF
jgi:Prokaryotic RING finger family 1